jgi:thiamine-phosphate pyrophosphorylase
LIVSVADLAARRAAILAALAAGFDGIQLRDRRAAGRALFDAATELRAMTRAASALLLVNDRVDVAIAADADGVHLPAASFRVAAARAALGPDACIGRSTHAPAEASAAAADGADYVVLGPIFRTPSKEPYGAPLGVAALGAVHIAVPLIAIGGITAANVADVLRAGADGVAVVRAVLDAPDPASAAAALAAALAR